MATSERGLCHVQLVVTVWPPGFADLTVGSFITVPSRDGDFYRLTSNYIYNGRGCGVISKASNGVISGNSINKMLYPAIELSPSFQAKEGSFVSNTAVGPSVIMIVYEAPHMPTELAKALLLAMSYSHTSWSRHWHHI